MPMPKVEAESGGSSWSADLVRLSAALCDSQSEDMRSPFIAIYHVAERLRARLLPPRV